MCTYDMAFKICRAPLFHAYVADQDLLGLSVACTARSSLWYPYTCKYMYALCCNSLCASLSERGQVTGVKLKATAQF